MSSPVIPNQFRDVVPAATQSVCQKMRNTLIRLPALIRDFFVYMLDEDGTISAEFKADLVSLAVPSGTILPSARSSVPSGYLVCNGQAVSRTLYADLFDALGTRYGTGDGSSTFNVPDLRDRFLVGVGADNSLGAQGGEKEHALTAAETGPHTHGLTQLGRGNADGNDTAGAPEGPVFESVGPNGLSLATETDENSGGDPHENRPPYQAVYYLIKT